MQVLGLKENSVYISVDRFAELEESVRSTVNELTDKIVPDWGETMVRLGLV